MTYCVSLYTQPAYLHCMKQTGNGRPFKLHAASTYANNIIDNIYFNAKYFLIVLCLLQRIIYEHNLL